MDNSIDWQKHYISLELQMRDMMKMTLKLIDDSNISIKEIVIENQKELKFVTVIANGNSCVYKFKCFDADDNLIDDSGYTYRNSVEISKYKNIDYVSVYAKENFEDEKFTNKVLYVI